MTRPTRPSPSVSPAPRTPPIADSQGVGTILDNDAAPSITINDISLTEGNSGSANAVFTVSLSAASGLPVTVSYATANGSATAGSDYTAASGTLSFAPGVTTRTVSVAVLGDLLDEADETFTVGLSGAANAAIADSQGVGTIVDNDAAPSITINDISLTEGNSGSANAVFTVSLSAASGLPVTVSYATANGSATAGSDYTAASGTLSFAPGVTTRTVSVAVLGDLLDEADETFTVGLSGAANAALADSQGVGTIVDNDAAPTPTPTVTPTPTPTPTPTVTPTPTPTPTVTPTPTPTPTSGPLRLDNVHDVLYENVTFRGSGTGSAEDSAVVYIVHASYNITFRNCVFETNGDGVGNGVTINDTGWGIHDVTFDHCHFDYQPRMGFECISRRFDRGAGNYPGYLRINLINCTFDAQGSEAISYDDDDPAHTYNGQPQGAGYCTISGNVVRGAGINSAYSWRRSFEINKTRNMTVTNNWFGPGVDGITNLRCNTDYTSSMNWTFSGNTWDATAFLPGVTYKAGAQLWYMANVQGGVTVADTMLQGSPYSTGSWGYLDSVNGADFSGSTIQGCPGVLSSYMSPGCTNVTWPTAR